MLYIIIYRIAIIV